jgi:hypothetical protein
VLKAFIVVVLALAVGIGFARTLTFGDKSPSRSRPPHATPSAAAAPARSPTPLPDRGAVAVTVSENTINVQPRSVRRDGRLVHVRVDNRAGYMIEFVLARGAALRVAGSPAALERAQIAPVLPMGTGEQRQHALRLTPGRYTVLARPLTEGDSAPAPAIGYATFRVR